MKQQLNIVVNGEPRELFIEPKTLLVQVIREHLGLTGTHQACDSSSCAACTIVVDGMAVKSCSILALQVSRESADRRRPAQAQPAPHPAAFIDNPFSAGSAPGPDRGRKALLDEHPDPTREEVQAQLTPPAAAPGTT